MDRRSLLALSGLAPALLAAGPRSTRARDPETPEVADHVLAAALSFGLGGGYDRSWKGSGAPDEIRHAGQRVLAEGRGGSYCCGFTFAVAMRVLEQRGALASKSVAEVRAFQKTWYGATAEAAEKQCALAAPALGVGREVSLDEARAGDFAQLWRRSRRPSGHSVVFLTWVVEDGERTGIAYLSSQGSTDGIGFRVEHLARGEEPTGRVDPARIYLARLDG